MYPDRTSFFTSLKGKTVAFCGIGRSHLPLLPLFAQYGATVLACDKRTREQLGQTADELEEQGVILRLGKGYLDNLQADWLFRTPGMYYHLPVLKKMRQQGVAVTSEMEVFFQLCPCPIYAVTGSDGKTTTTTLLAEFFKKSGKTVHLGGNIGRPLLPDIFAIEPDHVAVVELSSFQLISMRQSPQVAVVTNLSPNHLDVHKDMAEYVDAKAQIVLHQTAESRTVLNLDNETAMTFAPLVRGKLCTFSRKHKVKNGVYFSKDDTIVAVENGRETPLLHRKEVKLPGLHNVENLMAAMAAAYGAVPLEDMVAVAKTFAGVPHRAELVRVLHGVSYYNDSIGTSPSRTALGTLSLYDKKIILIAGGYDKHLDYTDLGKRIPSKVKELILLGATADKIQTAVETAPDYQVGEPNIHRVGSMEEAVQLAQSLAKEGDIVSLSPASASFDLYKNFEERGDHFKSVVSALT